MTIPFIIIAMILMPWSLRNTDAFFPQQANDHQFGADAAIFNAAGEILLVDRTNGTGWCLPCGFVEPNESPAEAAALECREETGLEVKVVALVDVFTRKPSAKAGPHTTVAVVFRCEVTGGALALSHESRDLRY